MKTLSPQTETLTGQMTDVFISYSRQDKVFVRRLYDAFESQDTSVWVDWESIPYAVGWWEEIREGIEKAHTVVFVITPDALKSQPCNDEISYAIRLNKRIIPIFRRGIDEHQIASAWHGKDWEAQACQNWEVIKSINWLYMRRKDGCECQYDNGNVVNPDCDGPGCDQDEFAAAFNELVKTIDADIHYLKSHTGLLMKALEWEVNQRDSGYVLYGKELNDIETWLDSTQYKTPKPTRLQIEFIMASTAERDRQEAEHRRQVARMRRLRRGLVLVFALLPFILAAVVVFRNQAIENARHAESLRLTEKANQILQANDDSVAAALLGIRALNSAYSHQAEAALQQALERDFLIAAFTNEISFLNAVALSPDGRMIATATGDETSEDRTHDSLQLWDAQTGQKLRELVGHSGAVTSVTFSPGSRYLLSGSTDHTARLWDIQSGGEVQQLRNMRDDSEERIYSSPDEGIVWSVAFAPDGHRIAIGQNDATTYLWDITDRDQPHKLMELRKVIESSTTIVEPDLIDVRFVAFSPDGRYLAASYGEAHNFGSTRVWDTETHVDMRYFVGSDARFSPDGTYLSTATGGLLTDKILHVWKLSDGSEFRVFTGGGVFAPDSRSIILRDGLHDLETGNLLRRFNFIASSFFPEFSPDGKRLLTVSTSGDMAWWNSDLTLVRRQFVGHQQRITDVQFSPDGRTILTRSRDQTVRLWDAQTGQELRRYAIPSYEPEGQCIETGPDSVFCENLVFHSDDSKIDLSPDGRYLVSGSTASTIWLWDVLTSTMLYSFQGHSDPVAAVAFSPDGRYVVTGGRDQTARLWNVETAEQVQEFRGSPGWITQAVFSSNGQYLLTTSGGERMTVRLWDVRSGGELQVYAGDNGIFWPDSRYVVTSDQDVVTLWDTVTAKRVREFRGHSDDILDITVSADGRYLLTASKDQTARLWDAANGKEIRRFSGFGHIVTSVAFSPDVRFVLTGLDDGTVRVWYTDYRESVSDACQQIFRDLTDSERAKFGITDDTPTCPSIAEQTMSVINRTLEPFSQVPTAALAVIPSPTRTPPPSATPTVTLTPSLVPVTLAWTPIPLREAIPLLSLPLTPRPTIKPSLAPSMTPTPGGAARMFDETQFTVHDIAFSPGGQYVATASGDRDLDAVVRLWEVKTGALIRQFVGHQLEVETVTFSPDGRFLLTASRDGMAKVWDVQNGTVLHEYGQSAWEMYSAEFALDGDSIVTFSHDNPADSFASDDYVHTIRRWNVESEALISEWILSGDYAEAELECWQLSPDGQYLGIGSTWWDEGIELWDTQTGKRVWQLPTTEDEGRIRNIAFSPDGQFILTAYVKVAHLRETTTGNVTQSFAAADNAWLFPTGLAVSPDNQYIMIGSEESGRIWLFDSQNGSELLAFPYGNAPWQPGKRGSVAFSPDGQYAVTDGGADYNWSTLWLWSMDQLLSGRR